MRVSTAAACSLAWCLSVSVASPSWSEQSEPASARTTAMLVEEVLVTARKRTDLESVQDVPLAVSAFSGDQIEAMFAVDLTDITANVPNASAYSVSTFPGYVNFFIRGMGVHGSVLSDDPAVGVFVDGVYQGVSAGILFDSFDLEAVEILRGPQGTLFGRNVTGGAALLRTRKPTEEFSARVRVIGGNDGNLQGAVSISGPLVEGKLLGKIAVFHTQLDDWMDNPAGNAAGFDDLGELDQQVFRGALTLLASDAFTADLRFEIGQSEEDPLANWALDNTLLLGVQPIPGVSEAAARDSDDPIANGVNDHPLEVEWTSGSIELNWDLPRGSLKSITALRELEQEDLTQDFDGSVLALFELNNTFIEQEQFSQELIYNLDVTETIDLTAGFFYFDQEFTYGERRFGALFAAAGGGLMAHSETDHQVVGLFAQADIALSEQWILTLGGRQSWEEKDVQLGQFGSSVSCTGFGGTDPSTCAFNFTGGDDWSNFTYKAGIQFLATENAQLYASYSRGFRSGGFNVRQNAGSVPGPYDEEIVDAIEVGAKADLAGGRVRINASLFFNEFDDLQRTVIAADGFQTVSNAAEATIKGIELETSWMIVDGLLLQANMGVIDAQLENFVNPRAGTGGAPLVIDGTNLPFVPEWQREVHLTYDIPLGAGSLTLRGTYRYVDSVESTDDNLGFPGSSYEEYDVSIAYAPNSSRWRIVAFGKNLTDNIENSLIINLQNPGWIINQARNPARYGVELLMEF